MRMLKKIFDFYIQSSLHVGLAVFSLVYVTAFSNDVCKHITYPCCLLFGTILGYNFLKYFEVFRKGRFHSYKFYGFVAVSFLAILGFMFFFIRMIDAIKIQLIMGGIMVLVYPLLRKYGIVKMFWVSFVVAYLTAFIFIHALPTFKGNVALEFIKRFVFLSALMIPFEIYDSNTDVLTTNTFPQKFGIPKTKIFGYILLVVFLLLSVYTNNYKHFFADALTTFLLSFFIYFSNADRNKYYTSFWVESVPIIWLGSLLLFQ